METFTVRVQLRNADSSNYEILHQQMELHGYERIVVSSEGISYHLPEAEYNHKSDKTTEDVIDEVYNIAKLIVSRPKVLVTRSKGRMWKGLEAE